MSTGTWLQIVNRKRWERVYGRGLAAFVRWRGCKYEWELEDRIAGKVYRGRQQFAIKAKWAATHCANSILRERLEES